MIEQKNWTKTLVWTTTR